MDKQEGMTFGDFCLAVMVAIVLGAVFMEWAVSRHTHDDTGKAVWVEGE